jgi:hypothetical protein
LFRLPLCSGKQIALAAHVGYVAGAFAVSLAVSCLLDRAAKKQGLSPHEESGTVVDAARERMKRKWNEKCGFKGLIASEYI